MNTKANVIISVAGLGSRMKAVNPDLHKSLLPYKDKPVLYHIIKSIPDNLIIGLILGHKSDQITDFLSITFPDKKFILVYTDDWTSNESGTGYSLKSALNFVDTSFWYFPCDGVYSNLDFINITPNEDLFIVSPIKSNETQEFLTFKTKDNRVVTSYFKLPNLENIFAFTGAMRVVDKFDFFKRLDESKSSEFISIINSGALTYLTKNWVDLGNSNSYNNAIGQSKFDFSKPNEFTYQLEDSIIKWWPDPAIASAKKNKPLNSPEVFPLNPSNKGEFFKYDLAHGVPFYEEVTPSNFEILLDWLEEKVWMQVNQDITSNLYEFYKVKTISRLGMLGDKKNWDSFNPKYVDGQAVLNWNSYFEKIDWDLLINDSRATFIHGDLQFDNIIFDPLSKKFTLIDWRHDFSGLGMFGDLYYDFAKLLGGIHQNYQQIKNGRLDFKLVGPEAIITVPSSQFKEELVSILEKKAESMGLNVKKIRLLIPLIYWNMSPLHKEPFSNICWCLGLKFFERYYK